MTTGSDDALDVALGLLRAPARRGALRARPLPDGMGELLAVASGSPDRVEGAALRSGHGAGELLEAARFYVQQVLLAESSDAYRVLGVRRDATHAEIRDHHRHLLRWLHPDRSEGAQWESAFATRVNQAWNQLRLPATRRDYDLGLAESDALAAPGVPANAGVVARTAREPAIDLRPRSQVAGPLTVLLLALLCIVLAWFAVHREDLHEDPFATAAAPAARAAPDIAQQMTASLPQRLDEVWVVAPAPRTAAATAAGVDGMADVTTSTDIEAAPLEQAAEPPQALRASHASAAATSPPARDPRDATAAAPASGVAARSHVAPGTQVAAGNRDARAGTGASASAQPEDPLHLFSQAEDTVRGVRAYLVGQGRAEPAWLDMSTALEGAGIRAQLRTRHRDAGALRMAIDAPAWTLDTDAARLLAAYRVSDRRVPLETGLLRIALVRRDGHWRIAQLQLEPAR